MPIHPAPPIDLDGLREAWHHTVQAVIDLGHGCRAEDFDRETDCPGWSVKDHIAHVAGMELYTATGEVADVAVPDYPHIRHEMGAFMERAVEARRGRAGEVILAELAEVAALRAGQFDRPDLSLDDVLPGPFAGQTVGEVLTIRAMDVWCHEQDIRHALGRPGNLDSPAAAVFIEGLFARLPRLIADADVLQPGQAVVIHSTGPIEGRAGVRVDMGEDGVPIAMSLFSGQGHVVSDDESTTGISLSTDALARRAAGRGSVDDVRATITGDEDVARRVLEAIAFVP